MKGPRSMYAPLLQNSGASSGTKMWATSGAWPLPAVMALRTSVSALSGTVLTMIHGYFCSKVLMTDSNSDSSWVDLLKVFHRVSVTGVCDALGLTVGCGDALLVPSTVCAEV